MSTNSFLKNSRMRQTTQENVDTHTASQGSTMRRTKALALLQELQQAEEQRLAELHTDYQPVPHLTRHEIMDSNQDIGFRRASRLYKRTFQSNLLSLEPEDPMVSDKSQQTLHRFHSLKNTELYCKKVHHSPYDEPCHRRALSDSVAELDATIADELMPELPGSEIDTSRSPIIPWRSGISYGDKRYNTLPGEAIPLNKSNT